MTQNSIQSLLAEHYILIQHTEVPEKNSRPIRYIKNATGLESVLLVVVQKRYWHHIVSFQLWKLESKTGTACLLFCSSGMLFVSLKQA